MGQEKLMKSRMVRALVLFGIAMLALLVFIGLYIDETRRVQETYRLQYCQSLDHVSEDIADYLGGEADYDMKYIRVTCDMGGANTFAFLLNDFNEERKAVNGLYTCLLKYPDQMRERMEELDTAVKDMSAGLDKGYDEAREIIDSINKMGT